MGYHRIAPTAPGSNGAEHVSTDSSRADYVVPADAALDTLGVRFYRARPGEQLPGAYHYHREQEEGFYVVSGQLTVETPSGKVRVPAGELFIVEPENPHRGYNSSEADTDLLVLAFGAPKSDSGVPYQPQT